MAPDILGIFLFIVGKLKLSAHCNIINESTLISDFYGYKQCGSIVWLICLVFDYCDTFN